MHNYRKSVVRTLVFCLAAIITARAANETSSKPDEGQRIISFLNQTIVWYHEQLSLQQLATDPSDVIYVNQSREIADEILRQSFDFARARAQVLSSTSATGSSSQNSTSSRYQSLQARLNDTEQTLKQAQAEEDNLRRRLLTATAQNRIKSQAAVAELQSEIDLAQTRRDALRNMLTFLSSTNSNGLGTGTLQSQIDELARTVPVAMTTTEKISNREAPSQAQQGPAVSRPQPSGILALITDLISLQRKKDTIEQSITDTKALAETAKAMRTPLVAEMRSLLSQGDQVTAAADNAGTAVLSQQKKQLDSLTAQFKHNSAATLPLGKQSVLLDIYKRSLANWQGSVADRHRAELKSLIIRLVILGIVIGFVFAISEIWRKATFRYIQDPHRRYQFLLLRRIIVWIVIAIVVAFAFATELGTLATFAGLLTAGVAVALQNVILSVAGYFFLIGKYGVRVGDRVQVAGITGDVIDIGLVRLHIMEASSGASDAHPTGRVVAISNAVVFQPNAGLFKQIPGTNFVWHEITLTLAPESNYQQVEERLMEAVRKVYAEYQVEMERQRSRMERSLRPLSVRFLEPMNRLRLTQTGLDVVIRYPVVLSDAAAIDDKVTRALLDAIAREPRLRLVGTGTPNIQPAAESAVRK